MRTKYLLLSSVFAISACADVEPSRVLAPEVGVPVDTRTAALSENGAVIIRDEFQVFFINVDAARNRISVHVPPGICQGAGLNIGDRMIVTTPSAILQELFLIKDQDSGVVILEGSSTAPLFANFCGTLNGPSRIASGTVRHIQTFTLASFAANWRGNVTTTDGRTVHLTEVYQLSADIHDPNNPATWSNNAVHILLNGR